MIRCVTSALENQPRPSSWRGRQIREAGDLAPELVDLLGWYPLEVLIVVPVDERSRVIECSLIGIGSAHRVTVPARTIWRRAIGLGAHRILMVHTHPSGDPSPTAA